MEILQKVIKGPTIGVQNNTLAKVESKTRKSWIIRETQFWISFFRQLVQEY